MLRCAGEQACFSLHVSWGYKTTCVRILRIYVNVPPGKLKNGNNPAYNSPVSYVWMENLLLITETEMSLNNMFKTLINYAKSNETRKAMVMIDAQQNGTSDEEEFEQEYKLEMNTIILVSSNVIWRDIV